MRLAAGRGLMLTLAVAGGYTAGLERADPPTAVAPAVRRQLDPRPVVVRSQGAVTMRLWFKDRLTLLADAGDVGAGARYRRIPEGALVGVVEFPTTFVDYRRQKLPPGSYTLRFALQPQTGEHTGTAPHREFLLLSPVDADRATENLDPKRLVELSRRVTSGIHPAVLLLWPADSPDASVRVEARAGGTWTAAVRRPGILGGRETPVRFAFTIAGAWDP